MFVATVDSREDAILLLEEAIMMYQEGGEKVPKSVLRARSKLSNPELDWDEVISELSEHLVDAEERRPFCVNGEFVIAHDAYEAYVIVAEDYEQTYRDPYLEGESVGVLTEERYENRGERVT